MPKAKDWSSFLSQESKARQVSPLKGLANYLKIPNLISLGGGLPNPSYFPFGYVDVRVPSEGRYLEQQILDEGTTLRIVKSPLPTLIQSPTDHDTTLNGGDGVSSKGYPTDLSVTLQYAQGFGDVELRKWAKEHIATVHNPPYEDWDVTLTIGNTMSFEVCLRTLFERGDSILMEEYAYTSGIFACRPQGINIVGIAMDGEGMKPDKLDERLLEWDELKQGRKPRVAYLVPYSLFPCQSNGYRTGQNPSGATMFLERRKALYSIFQKHDILVIEDEPYCTQPLLTCII